MGKILTENVHRSFKDAPYYLVYDTDNGFLDQVRNYSRFMSNAEGLFAVQVLIDKSIDVLIAGQISDACREILTEQSVHIFDGYPGTCEEALAKLKDESFHPVNAEQRESSNTVVRIDFLRDDFKFQGKDILYDDWDFILNIKPLSSVAKNWQDPIDYENGLYHLRLEVLEMKTTEHPVAFEFVWFNYPEKEDPERLHRCSFGHYCFFSRSGTYEHIAMIKDMEITTISSLEKDWNWKRAWDSPFILIKPYGQDPFPINARISLSLYGKD